ncbi:MAG: hypothetical protein ACE5JL_09930 [Dehalococcoidia bacterium]
MSKEQRLLISLGAAIIVTIMLIGAFSLGVYVGERGWTRQGPRSASPGQPPLGRRPVQRPPGWLGRPALVGPVRSITEDTIVVDTPQGPRLVMVSGKTLVRRRLDDREEEASLEDIEQGTLIAVFGELEGRTLMARLIIILPAKR